MRLQEKIIQALPDGTRRIRRRYEPAQTPFDRLLASDVLPPDTRRQLEALRLATNPRKLRQEIYDLLAALHRLSCTMHGQAQDVYLTLFASPAQREEEALTR
jgi:hypothetical protein